MSQLFQDVGKHANKRIASEEILSFTVQVHQSTSLSLGQDSWQREIRRKGRNSKDNFAPTILHSLVSSASPESFDHDLHIHVNRTGEIRGGTKITAESFYCFTVHHTFIACIVSDRAHYPMKKVTAIHKRALSPSVFDLTWPWSVRYITVTSDLDCENFWRCPFSIDVDVYHGIDWCSSDELNRPTQPVTIDQTS